MATATETLTVTEVKQAMGVLKLDNWTDELLDEIELDRELQLSLDEEDTISLDELERRVTEKAANGYYRR
jgi:hypothetical protein